MSLYLVAIIIENKKKKYRIIDIDDRAKRKIENGKTLYKYQDVEPNCCLNKTIGGLRERSDKIVSFRTPNKIPVIDVDQAKTENLNTLMKCTQKIFVNYKGERILYNDRPSNVSIIDIRPLSQKSSDSGTKGARKRWKDCSPDKLYRNKARKKT